MLTKSFLQIVAWKWELAHHPCTHDCKIVTDIVFQSILNRNGIRYYQWSRNNIIIFIISSTPLPLSHSVTPLCMTLSDFPYARIYDSVRLSSSSVFSRLKAFYFRYRWIKTVFKLKLILCHWYRETSMESHLKSNKSEFQSNSINTMVGDGMRQYLPTKKFAYRRLEVFVLCAYSLHTTTHIPSLNIFRCFYFGNLEFREVEKCGYNRLELVCY